MNDTQILTIAMSTAPTMLIVLIGILINNARLGDLNSRFNDLSGNINSRFNDMNLRITETNARIDELRSHMDARFEEMKDLWRSQLHRVEEVIDARLKHIEGR